MPPPLIVLLCVTVFVGMFTIGSFPALLPDIGASHGLVDWQLGALAGVFGLARMLADLPVGLFITHNLRRAVVLAPLGVAGGLLLLASGGPYPVLILGRALMGLGHTLGLVAGLTAILRFQTGWGLGAALNAYEFSAMLGMLGAIAAVSVLPRTLAWNLALLAVGAPLAISLLLIPALLAVIPAGELRRGAPLFARPPGAGAAGPARVTPLVVLAFGMGGAIAMSYSMLEQFVIPVRGTREFGLDRAGIARLLMTVQLVDLAAIVPVGFVADRLGARRVLGVAALLVAAAVGLIAFGGLGGAVAGCVLFGLGMTGWMLPLSLLRSATPPERVGWRTALYRVAVDGGMFAGPFASGLLAGIAPGLLPTLLMGVLLGLGIFLLSMRPAPPMTQPAEPAR